MLPDDFKHLKFVSFCMVLLPFRLCQQLLPNDFTCQLLHGTQIVPSAGKHCLITSLLVCFPCRGGYASKQTHPLPVIFHTRFSVSQSAMAAVKNMHVHTIKESRSECVETFSHGNYWAHLPENMCGGQLNTKDGYRLSVIE